MRWLVLSIALLSTPALADQPKVLTLTVPVADAQTIVNQLSTMPWKDVNHLMISIINQINVQMVPPKPVEPPKPAEEPKPEAPPPPPEKSP
jgi:hypothetical protein